MPLKACHTNLRDNYSAKMITLTENTKSFKITVKVVINILSLLLINPKKKRQLKFKQKILKIKLLTYKCKRL